MSGTSFKLSKLQQRLEAAIEEKRFYEAHQIYKTLYFRCTTRRNYAEALRYLYSGAEFLLSNQQWESGTDLACLVLQVYAKSKMDLTEVQLNQLCGLLNKMPATEERVAFVCKATAILKPHKNLLCGFNEQLGRLFWLEGSFCEARFRFMLSLNGYAVGSFLIALHQRYGLRSEIDLFITQAVLQFLCMRQPSAAIQTFYTYTRGHPRLEPGPPFTRFPLLNFIWFLLLVIDRTESFTTFCVLCEKYRPQINRDSTYATYLETIGRQYFGTPNSEPNTMFSRILKMFGGSVNDADDLFATSSSDVAGPSGHPDAQNVISSPGSTRSPGAAMQMEDVD
ncbi:Golgi to er traffic protein 4 [Fasciolopsis buskii]|uniref:Golgi to er traffic protein 4 n=1 Tax=Fasciolopsis buskii TaxID=27845 RepID=A0A8E0VIZ9_9TREM|nr:Golgi to er traffic protein 4 [Fasciolopsis buski]